MSNCLPRCLRNCLARCLKLSRLSQVSRWFPQVRDTCPETAGTPGDSAESVPELRSAPASRVAANPHQRMT